MILLQQDWISYQRSSNLIAYLYHPVGAMRSHLSMRCFAMEIPWSWLREAPGTLVGSFMCWRHRNLDPSLDTVILLGWVVLNNPLRQGLWKSTFFQNESFWFDRNRRLTIHHSLWRNPIWCRNVLIGYRTQNSIYPWNILKSFTVILALRHHRKW